MIRFHFVYFQTNFYRFFCGIMTKQNELNISLQDTKKSIYKKSQKIEAFQKKFIYLNRSSGGCKFNQSIFLN